MSHNFTSGVWVKDLSTGQMGGKAFWHGLGHEEPQGLPIREYFKRGGALYGVSDRAIYLEAGGRPIPGYRALVNEDTDEVLSIQSSEYHVISNERLVDLAEALREDTEIISVAVMGGGRRAAFSARLRGLEGEVKGDRLEMKLSGVNSFDGSQAFTVLFDPTRIECDNTLGFAVRSADQKEKAGKRSILRVTHRSGADQIIKQIPHVIDFANRTFTKSIEEVEAMANAACDVALFKRILEITFQDELRKPINEKRGDKSTERPRRLTDIKGYDDMCNNFAGDLIGLNKATEGTVWGAFNAITQFYRHQVYKGGKNAEARRYGSLQFGVNQMRIQRAHAAALSATRA